MYACLVSVVDRWGVAVGITLIVLVLLAVYWPRRTRYHRVDDHGMQKTVRMQDTVPVNTFEAWAQSTDRQSRDHRRKERGGIVLDLLPYLIGAAVVCGMAYAAYHWVDTTWQTSAGVAEGKRLEHAAMQPKLDSCNSDLGDANIKLATQSASIAAAASAAAAQAASAKKLAADARVAQADNRTEMQRLADAIRQGTKPSACPAGAALAKVREGLK